MQAGVCVCVCVCVCGVHVCVCGRHDWCVCTEYPHIIRIVEVSVSSVILNQHTTRIYGCILSVHRRVSTNIGALC